MPRKRTIDIRQPELADAVWQRLAPLLPEPEASLKGGPKPVPNRQVVEGILWVLRNGGSWKALPEGFPSPSTCWRRLVEWEGRGVWLEAWSTFLRGLDAEHRALWQGCVAISPPIQAARGETPPTRRRRRRVRSGWPKASAETSHQLARTC